MNTSDHLDNIGTGLLVTTIVLCAIIIVVGIGIVIRLLFLEMGIESLLIPAVSVMGVIVFFYMIGSYINRDKY